MENILSSADSQPLNELVEDSKPEDVSDEPAEGSKPEDVSDEPAEGSKPEDVSDEPAEGSKPEDVSDEPAEGSKPEDVSDEPAEDSKLTDPTEQKEDSRSQDPNEQSEDGIQIRQETSGPQSWEEQENSMISVSGSWGKTNTDSVDDTSSFLVPELSRSSQDNFLSSEIQAIKHSPLTLTKSSYLRGFVQEPRAPNLKGSKIQKQRIPVGIKRKKESKRSFQAWHHTTGSCEGNGSYLGRRSKALHNLYTTFCDEDNKEEADPGFLQRTEGSPTASGLSRACTIFSALKKGRINVSNLLLTLHTLGILMARADMHQALKYTAVDERGNLNFLEFLNIVSLTTPISGTMALQKARQVFRKLKKDMVSVEDLESVLASLEVTLSPTIIEKALRRIQITSYLDEYPALNWRSFGDVNGYSEFRWRRTCSSDRDIPAHQTAMITFCSAEEAIAFTEFQKQKNKPQRPVYLKRPSTTSPICPEEESKKKDTIKWPKVRPSFGYTSQDTLFPLKSTLRSKATESVPIQQAETENQSCEDPSSLLSQSNISTKDGQTKKKLSFYYELPKRCSTEDSRVSNSTPLEIEVKVSAEDISEATLQ
uniref:Uncharacterized protein n=1 Tax=Sphaerodactylus townsendi TaxID=933632 RepID=A0ACB8EUX7_9SAUR